MRYQFTKADEQVIAAIKRLLIRLSRYRNIRPAELVSVAKVLHVFSRVPLVTEGVRVTIEISCRTELDGWSRSSIWHLSVRESSLALSCGGFESNEAVGTDSFTTMFWQAEPGEPTEFDGRWDEGWMEREDPGETDAGPIQNFDGFGISVEDEDNALLDEFTEVEG